MTAMISVTFDDDKYPHPVNFAQVLVFILRFGYSVIVLLR